VDVGLCFKKIIEAGLVIFLACTADVLDDVPFEVAKLLINDEVPYLDGTLLVMIG